MNRDIERTLELNRNLDLKLNITEESIMNIEEAFHKYDIRYTVNIVNVKNGEKSPVNLKRLRLSDYDYAKVNGFNENGGNHEILTDFHRHRELWESVCHAKGYNLVFSHQTGEWIVIDVDNIDDVNHPFIRRLLLKYPFYLSMSRRLFKLIIPRCEINMPPSLYNVHKTKILQGTDILGENQWSFVPTDAVLFNADFTYDKMYPFDFADCPLTPCPSPKTSRSSSSSLSSYEPYEQMTEERLDMMLAFIQESSALEHANDPSQQVAATYNGEGHSWLKMASAIKSWDDGDKGFDKLHEFSKNAPNYNPDFWIGNTHSRAYRDWSNCVPISLGYIVNLYHYFQNIFPSVSAYETPSSLDHKEMMLMDVIEKDEVNHYNIALLFLMFDTFKNRYKYSNASSTWFELVEPSKLWRSTKKIGIINFLTHDFLPFLNSMIEKVNDKTLSQLLKKLRMKVGMTDFQNGIVRNCKDGLTVDNFDVMLDCNPNLLSFNNGVFDITTKSFRQRRATDYISLCTKHDYVHDIPQDALTFFENFLTTISMTREQEKNDTQKKEIYDFFSKVMCLFVFGRNTSNSVVVYTGEGGNGKSMLFRLHTLGLGNYIKKIESTFFTTVNKNSHGTSPIATCQGLRLVYTSEPDENQRLNDGLIKDISGAEPLNVRALYKDDIQLMVQFVVYFQTNEMSLVNNTARSNKSLLRRFIMFNFPNSFENEDKYNEQDPSHRLADHCLEVEIEKYARYWASYLVQMFVKYHGHCFPKKNLFPFLEASRVQVEEYLEESNTVQMFMEDNYIPLDCNVEKKESRYCHSLNELAQTYNQTYKTSYNNRKFGRMLRKCSAFKKSMYKNSTIYYYLKPKIDYDDDRNAHGSSSHDVPL